MKRAFHGVAFCLAIACGLTSAQKPHTLNYAPGKSITLSVPEPFDIHVTASGLPRVRFFAKAPDGRTFATGMYTLADNRRGTIYILEGWDNATLSFQKVTRYLEHLRNPNSIAFWTDGTTGQSWLYVALTDKLVRYHYHAGDEAPSSPPETLIRFPDYGLNYKYGGWHLTRTVTVAQLDGKPRILVTAGSSCNYCQEREVLRAAAVSMDPDGSHPTIVAQGLRNAVAIKQVADLGNAIFVSNMGDDHLGDKLPEDTFFQLEIGSTVRNYGWPTCYFANGKPVLDHTPLPSPDEMQSKLTASTEDSVYGQQKGVAAAGTNLLAGGSRTAAHDPNAALGNPPRTLGSCDKVPAAYTTFTAHSSPLGFEHFPAGDASLSSSFLVALHGAGHPRLGTGYRVVRFTPADRTPHDFITGFLTFENGKPVVHGRPCGILRVGPDSFLLSDDYLGLVYLVHRHS
jgi:glucose/arabinose dehydrogenase